MSNQPELINRLQDRLTYLSDRQEVLTKNIANSDTPGFRAKELAPPTFKETLKTTASAHMKTTNPMHMSGSTNRSSNFAGKVVVNHTPAEVSPNGNTVSLEDEMRKAAENVMDYQMTTNLYKSQMGMLSTAAGKAN